MAGFLDELWLRHDGAADRWTTAKELRYVSRAGKTYTVPAGVSTDLASIPRMLWSILPPAGRWLRAAIVHDFCYEKRIGSREECDRLFLEAMIEDGVSKPLAKTLYAACRIGGRAQWLDND